MIKLIEAWLAAGSTPARWSRLMALAGARARSLGSLCRWPAEAAAGVDTARVLSRGPLYGTTLAGVAEAAMASASGEGQAVREPRKRTLVGRQTDQSARPFTRVGTSETAGRPGRPQGVVPAAPLKEREMPAGLGGLPREVAESRLRRFAGRSAGPGEDGSARGPGPWADGAPARVRPGYPAGGPRWEQAPGARSPIGLPAGDAVPLLEEPAASLSEHWEQALLKRAARRLFLDTPDTFVRSGGPAGASHELAASWAAPLPGIEAPAELLAELLLADGERAAATRRGEPDGNGAARSRSGPSTASESPGLDGQSRSERDVVPGDPGVGSKAAGQDGRAASPEWRGPATHAAVGHAPEAPWLPPEFLPLAARELLGPLAPKPATAEGLPAGTGPDGTPAAGLEAGEPAPDAPPLLPPQLPYGAMPPVAEAVARAGSAAEDYAEDDDLDALADRLRRVLEREARRYGIDV